MKPNTGTSQRVGIVRVAVAAVALLLAALAPRAEAQTVRVTTDVGEFVIELQPDRAPLTVANFLRYVNEGFYTNTLFHRVVSGFVVQGGGYSVAECKASPDCKPKATHEALMNESGNGLQNKRATVGMARGGPPHSGNAQFYVNVADNPELDPLPTRWGYAVFGRVTEGMDVIDKIGVVATGAVPPFKSEAPLKPVIILKIELVKSGSVPVAPTPSVNPATMPQSGTTPPPQ